MKANYFSTRQPLLMKLFVLNHTKALAIIATIFCLFYGSVNAQSLVINSFSPDSASFGEKDTIKGKGFTGATAVSFGGDSAASFKVLNDSTVIAVVGIGASGKISIVTPSGTASLSGFIYTGDPGIGGPGGTGGGPGGDGSPLVITSFTPTSASTGTTDTIRGKGFTGARSVSFGVDTASSFKVLNDSIIAAVVGAGASGYVYVLVGIKKDSLAGFVFKTNPEYDLQGHWSISGNIFNNSSPFPSYSSHANNLMIKTAPNTFQFTSYYYPDPTTGAYFASYSFQFQLDSNNNLKNWVALNSTMPAAPASGFMTLDNPGNESFTNGTPGTNGYTQANYNNRYDPATHTLYLHFGFGYGNGYGFGTIDQNGYTVQVYQKCTLVPTLTSFSPTSAPKGDTVIIRGSDFTDVVSVTFGDTTASSFKVLNDSTITAIVGNGASGNVSVGTSYGTTGALAGFNYCKPIVDTIGQIGIGSYSWHNNNNTKSGFYTFDTLSTLGCDSLTVLNLTIKPPLPIPVITSFSPTSATSGIAVTIKGINLSSISSVTFGDSSAATFSVINDSIITAVIGGGTSGSVTVANYSGSASLGGFSFITPLESDSLALVDLYNNTQGSNWLNNTNWLSGSLNTWHGVTVNAFNNRVTAISLLSNKLTGSLPNSIGNLSALRTLNLNNNFFVDTIPASICNLASLVSLNLGRNKFVGKIPDSIGRLNSLVSLTLSPDSLSGNIPASITNLVNLSGLNLGPNKLTGNIPDSIGVLTKLTTLSLINNKLTGSIPASIGNLMNLTSINLEINKLSGDVPSSLGNLVKLQTLALGYNQLSGYFPDTISKLPYAAINISFNKFTFSGLETLASSTGKGAKSYTSQDSIPLYRDSTKLWVSAGGTLANNTFKWYNNKVLVATIVGDSTYAITSSGRYYVKVTNSIAKGLILNSYIDSINILTTTTSITAYYPDTATKGTIVTIKGRGFTGTTSVTFGDTLAASFVVVNDSTITAVVGNGAGGNISVTSANGTATLSGFIYISSLPIGLSSFSAIANNKTIKTNWQTSKELNTSHFIMQHSTDGSSFSDIGTVKAVGSGANSYSFIDNSPVSGKNYYRLKSVDKDGASIFSAVVSCEWLVVSKQFAVYPNPAKDKVTINGSHITSVQVIDNMGRVVKVVLLKDETNPTLSVAGLAAGVYHLRVESEDGVVSSVSLMVSGEW